MTSFNNIPQLKHRRRALRSQSVPSEIQMWAVLRGRKFLGLKFRRQHSVGWFIVDFYCPALRLAIEIDGEHHTRFGEDQRDIHRQSWIENQGVTIVRFASDEVNNNLDGVLRKLEVVVTKLGWTAPGYQ